MSGVSNGQDVLTKTFTISDAAVNVYRLVTGDTTDTTNILPVAKVATADTQLCLGIAQETTTAADQRCAIRMEGTGLLEVDGSAGAIDIGTKIVAAAGGIGVAATAVDATAQEVVGFALAPSVASGDIILIHIARMSLVKGTA